MTRPMTVRLDLTPNGWSHATREPAILGAVVAVLAAAPLAHIGELRLSRDALVLELALDHRDVSLVVLGARAEALRNLAATTLAAGVRAAAATSHARTVPPEPDGNPAEVRVRVAPSQVRSGLALLRDAIARFVWVYGEKPDEVHAHPSDTDRFPSIEVLDGVRVVKDAGVAPERPYCVGGRTARVVYHGEGQDGGHGDPGRSA